MNLIDPGKLGKPDIKIGGLCIWVHGRQFDDARDYWDGNWLSVTAHYGCGSSHIWVTGPILHLSEVTTWVAELEELYKQAQGSARLKCIEPNLSVEIELRSTGNGEARIEITPDHMKENHWFLEHIDQSYLPALIRALGRLVKEYPVRGRPGE